MQLSTEAIGVTYRNKAWHYLRQAMRTRNEPPRAAHWLGRACVAIDVMTETSHPAAYRALERYNLVWRICKIAAQGQLQQHDHNLKRLVAMF